MLRNRLSCDFQVYAPKVDEKRSLPTAWIAKGSNEQSGSAIPSYNSRLRALWLVVVDMDDPPLR